MMASKALRHTQFLGENITQKAQLLVFGNPLYRFTLGGGEHHINALSASPFDPWPGDAAHGRAMLEGTMRFAGQSIPIKSPRWSPKDATQAWKNELHSFEWLRNLRAVGSMNARRFSRIMTTSWLDKFAHWNEPVWRADVLGLRLANWIAFHDFFWASAEDDFRADIFGSILKQSQHLSRTLFLVPGGLPLLLALKGLVYTGLALPGQEGHLELALKYLRKELPKQIPPDGCHYQRSPSLHLKVLRHLIDLRAALFAAKAEMPDELQYTIDRMAPTLRFFQHGDSGLALFNDSCEEDSTLIDTVLNQADAKGRPLRSLPHAGFERLNIGRTLVIVDTGTPPCNNLTGALQNTAALDQHSHAGTLSFEMSVGQHRFLVNCGASFSDTNWSQMLKTTAAHNSVTLNETNSSEILAGGHIGRRPSIIKIDRVEEDGNCLLIMTHDGYKSRLGTVHTRRLYLNKTGDDFRGEDLLIGSRATPDFKIRFHLHPDVQLSLTKSKHAALCRLPDGNGWRFRFDGATLSLEDSIYFGTGLGQKTQQLVLSGTVTRHKTTSVRWSFHRENKS